MDDRITPKQIKNVNKKIIYDYLYSRREKGTTQQEISNALTMSRPTVAGKLTELEDEGLIYEDGIIETSQFGRKPSAWYVRPDYKIAVGVEILKHIVRITAINLYGQELKTVKKLIEYENSGEYYEKICVEVKNFVKNFQRKILGIGFALQGLVSKDGKTIIYGEILKCTGMKIDVFSSRLDFPCRFMHEPDGAALAELWASPTLKSAIYLSMSEHLGGALISNRKILNGTHRHSATFEHIQAVHDGELCYCGKTGCYETVCSKVALLNGEKPDEFFHKVRANEPDASQRWGKFLRYLGKLIAALHLMVDTKYILGGHLAPYFTEDDIKILYEEIRERNAFSSIESDDYILLSKMPSNNITIGAALPYVIKFLENFGSEKN